MRQTVPNPDPRTGLGMNTTPSPIMMSTMPIMVRVIGLFFVVVLFSFALMVGPSVIHFIRFGWTMRMVFLHRSSLNGLIFFSRNINVIVF